MRYASFYNYRIYHRSVSLMFQILHEISVSIGLAGIHFLGCVGPVGVEALIKRLGHSDERIVNLAEDKLRQMGSMALPRLIRALKTENALIQNRSTKLLADMGSETIPWLCQKMDSKDKFVRLQAISVLGLVGARNQAAIPHLIDVLVDPSVEIRKNAKEALKQIGRPAQVCLLRTMKVKAKSDKYHAYKIAETISGFGEKAIPDLIDILKTGNQSIRHYAMLALRFMGKAVLSAIIPLLKHEQDQVRSSAAKTCEMMIQKAKDAIPALTDALADENNDVRYRAAMALGIVGGDPSRFLPILEELSLPLDGYDCYELYHMDHKYYRVQITEKDPIVGEVGWDRIGLGFLTPEKDERGGGMRSIPLVGNFFRSGKGKTGQLTRVSGFYEKGVGILVTNMIPDETRSDYVF